MQLNQLFNLTGKTALVTGADRGIGRAMALGLAAAGAAIIGVSRSIPLNGSEVEKAVTGFGVPFTAYQADLSDRASLYGLIEKLQANHPRIDILINNAGAIMRAPALQHPDDYWDNVMAINLDAPFILARELAKNMVERGSGKIVFTCSLLSFQGGINVPGYAASKGALASLVKALANEWAAKGVNVNGIAPGYIATHNTEALRQDVARNKAILERIPAGRWGDASDLVGPAVFLSSAAADYVHGTILTVDGGWMGR